MVPECVSLSGKRKQAVLVTENHKEIGKRKMEANQVLTKVNRKPGAPVLIQKMEKGVEYLSFPGLEATGMVQHLISTRTGGVSEGMYATMNVSYTRGDRKEAVDENFRRIAAVFHSTPHRMVSSHQTHTTNIRLVTEADCGKGITKERDYSDIDGLITNVPEIILATFYADCVPLFFVDCRNNAIGLSHSGWKGTVEKMGEAALRAMKQAFGTSPEDVKAAIGPSICRDCYEVSEDVAEVFRKAFPVHFWEFLINGKQEGKYQLDLWAANRHILLQAGVLPENIEVTDICTCCNSRFLFSHRASAGKRGNIGAFMQLRKS